jgi:Ankyrin repeats (3 copies)
VPTKQLPPHPNLDQLKHQAKDLLKARQAGDAAALQRIREFHPRFARLSDAAIAAATFTLTDAQLAIAREYGFSSWPRLRARIERSTPADKGSLPQQERIEAPLFRRAVDLLDSGDADVLRSHLQSHPDLARERVTFEGGNYFHNPTLLEFIAENPVRQGKLPSNIVELTGIILDAGGKADQSSIDSTLALVCSGRVPRECGKQVPLIELLCDYGADPNQAMLPALAHGEFGSVDALLRRGANLNLAVAAATGSLDNARPLLPASTPEDRHTSLALAAQHGRTDIVRLLLDAGEDPNRYNPVGCHSHSTPLHQAAWNSHLAVVTLLVENGARLDIKDILFQGTPLGWAEHAGRTAIAHYLRSQAGGGKNG